MEWVLVLFMYTTDKKDPEYVDKVAIHMKGPMTSYCKKNSNGHYVLRKPLEGTDYHKVYNQCVTLKHWRGE